MPNNSSSKRVDQKKNLKLVQNQKLSILQTHTTLSQ